MIVTCIGNYIDFFPQEGKISFSGIYLGMDYGKPCIFVHRQRVQYGGNCPRFFCFSPLSTHSIIDHANAPCKWFTLWPNCKFETMHNALWGRNHHTWKMRDNDLQFYIKKDNFISSKIKPVQKMPLLMKFPKLVLWRNRLSRFAKQIHESQFKVMHQ